MVDVVLACKLFSALTNETRIIIVGDVDQIPSVSPGNVLEDIIKTGKIKTIKFYFSAFFLIKILVFEVFFLSLNEFT